eukprot:TRINITY_DN12695_c0_g1_i1.p1 TRINITY_DN12695_c0_g1~~TRINITY_DN12695_c0_g1_i1.p1  ORF type:complete len:941 (+),score=408.75 TRINITY_DN12695_c0_g1_i1:48-2870(+)
MAPDIANIRVLARVNPKPGDVCLRLEGNQTIVPVEESGSLHHHKFNFDHVFDREATQDEVFEDVGLPTVDKVLEGYNGTVFAYGQTGSGKTHTMLAPEGGSSKCLDPLNVSNFAQRGLIPRMATELFERLDVLRSANKALKHTVTVSYYEIYNEELIDLLRDKNDKGKIRLEGTKETFKINGLVCVSLEGPARLLDLIQRGTSRRHIASTAMNDTSSRSHSVIQLNIVQNDTVFGNITTSQLNLVDLAGCESLGRTGATGQTAFEGTRINLSLTTLGIVINQLCRGEKFISFRDSLLTRVLQNSLGGNAITTVVVTMSQLRENYSDTLSVLRFAERAKQIKNKARINKQRTAAEWEMMFKRAEEEIESLKQRLSLAHGKTMSPLGTGPDPVSELKAKLDAELAANEDLKEVLGEKEKENFHLDQRLHSAEKEVEEIRVKLDGVELEKIENAAMYETTLAQLKKAESDLKAVQKAKAELQSTINKLEVELAGMTEELKHKNVAEEAELQQELILKTETILRLEREIKELKEQLALKDKEIAKLRAAWDVKEQCLEKQIASLRTVGSDATIEAAINSALDQQNGAFELLKIETDSLREEVHNMRQKVVEQASDLAMKTTEAETAKSQVAALQQILDKNKKSQADMLEAVKRNAKEIAILKQDNLVMAEKLAGSDSTLAGVEAARDAALRDLEKTKEAHATAKASLEKAQDENEILRNKIRELELQGSRREHEAEKTRTEVHTLGRTVSVYNGKMKEKDDHLGVVQKSMKNLAQLIMESTIPRSDQDKMMNIINAAIEPKDRDMLDKLSDKIYDEKTQHELVGHVVAVMEDRISDVRDMEAKLEQLSNGDDVVPESFKHNLSILKRQLTKVTEVLSIREYANVEDEARRQDMLPAAEELLEKVKTMEQEMDTAFSRSGTFSVCPFCQELFDKKTIRAHVDKFH